VADPQASDLFAVRSECIRRVKDAFQADGFDLPEPIYGVRVNPGAPAPEPAPRAPAPGTLAGEQDLPEAQIAAQLARERSDEEDLLR